MSTDDAMEDVLTAGELVVRPSHLTASARGQVLPLSKLEFELLVFLMRRRDRIISREDLQDAVWGRPYTSSDRSVDVYVHKLRVKLGSVLPEWQHIHTHFGLGYRFHPERSQDLHTAATVR